MKYAYTAIKTIVSSALRAVIVAVVVFLTPYLMATYRFIQPQNQPTPRISK